MLIAEEVFALTNLLPAGVVHLYFEYDGIIEPPAAAESEDWNALTPFLDTHRLRVIQSSQHKLQCLHFLVRHWFLRAAWRVVICNGVILVYVRVYLIPYDLPGTHGSLLAHHRDRQKLMLDGRKALIFLLNNTNRSAKAWAHCSVSCDDHEPFFSQQRVSDSSSGRNYLTYPVTQDIRSLSEIYGELPSPAIDPSTFLSGTDPRTRRFFRHALYWESPPGMRPLYPYQRRTVARMLKQELDPGVAPDPLYIPIKGVEGSDVVFYLQPSTMEVLGECPMRSQAKGGILCEEMGTGKTCIVLGLIMATKHQLSSPEEPKWDEEERPILTPLAFQNFLTPQFEHARQVARVKERSTTFPSLVEILTHFIRASPELIDPPGFDDTLKEHLQADHLWEPLAENHPFYHVFEHVPESASPRRKALDRGPRRGPRKVYLTSATLIIVPRAILAQWNSEINKHCDDGSIRHLSLDIGPKSRPMPSADELASKYDIVLLTHEKFAAEKARCNPLPLHTWTHCRCPVIEDSRVPRCTCSQISNNALISPLIQIRWKRLVVDEGHVSAAASNLAKLCQELNVERRWIVSGTPTRNLMGLSLGQSEDPENVDESPIPDDNDVEEVLLTTADEQAIDEKDAYSSDSSGAPIRVWTRVDRDDLAKLGDMISKFIGVPQFAYEVNLFRKMVASPLLDRHGPSFGAIQVVSQVMSQVMFRHRIQDVESELPEKLPPLKEKTVSLKFHPLAAKTYNVLQAGIAVNAVDSERQDQDYLFHPTSRAALRLTLENITQAMFWHTDTAIFDVEAALGRSEEALRTAHSKGLPESDINLVEDSIRVQREALEDQLWTTVMKYGDNPFVVRGLSAALQTAWLKIDAHMFEGHDPLLDTDRLCKLRDVLLRSPLISEHSLIEHGLVVAAEEARAEELYAEWLGSKKRKNKHDEGVTESLKVKKFNVIERSTVKELNRELTAAITRRDRGEVERRPSLSFEPAARTIGNFSSISIGKSASSKLNYLIKKVRKHAPKEKFLIFSAFPLSLAYVEDALRLVEMPYLKYTSGIKPHLRQQSVVTFETSEKYRVLLMELKLGARGLNLVHASRIIFCEPVWHGDVESQAIKRAHRIGQKCKQLKVTTLVMEGTSEEAMVTRRHALRRKSEKLPAMEEDASLSKFLQNPTFLRPENIESPDAQGIDMPLIGGTGGGEQPLAECAEIDVDVSRSASSKEPQDSRSPPKRRKMVHFG